jgi:hypothetical protein
MNRALFDADAVSISGPMLASLMYEVGAEANMHVTQSPALRYREGLLFGCQAQRLSSSTGDHHEAAEQVHHELVLQEFACTGGRCSMFDLEAAKPLPESAQRDQAVAGYFVVKKASVIRPSLRELDTYRSLQAQHGARKPFVFLILAASITSGSNTQSFQYQFFAESSSGKLTALPCRIRNLKHDTAKEYAMFYPSPLPQQLAESVSGAALQNMSAAKAMPPHLTEQSALFQHTVAAVQVRHLA